MYIPIYFQWAYYSFLARSLFFFNAANPTIRNGGFFMESKKEIYDLIPQQYYPRTILIRTGTSFNSVLEALRVSGIRFPLIAKPDIGLRGSAVKKILNTDELLVYSGKTNFDYLLQDLIPYPNEVGIFYVRYPHEITGRITGIVAKEFLILEGNGKSTLEELLKKDPRYEMQLPVLQRQYGTALHEVMPLGEKRNLVPYGNHARGAKFIDVSSRITPALTSVIDGICLQIRGFYFGRIDLMYHCWEELERGENFSIVEVNGAGSEPTHIYDPAHSIFFAWKELSRHIRHMYHISVENHRNGAQYLSHKKGMKEFRDNLEHDKSLARYNESN